VTGHDDPVRRVLGALDGDLARAPMPPTELIRARGDRRRGRRQALGLTAVVAAAVVPALVVALAMPPDRSRAVLTVLTDRGPSTSVGQVAQPIDLGEVFGGEDLPDVLGDWRAVPETTAVSAPASRPPMVALTPVAQAIAAADAEVSASWWGAFRPHPADRPGERADGSATAVVVALDSPDAARRTAAELAKRLRAAERFRLYASAVAPGLDGEMLEFVRSRRPEVASTDGGPGSYLVRYTGWVRSGPAIVVVSIEYVGHGDFTPGGLLDHPLRAAAARLAGGAAPSEPAFDPERDRWPGGSSLP
jgi:hypothetical protein